MRARDIPVKLNRFVSCKSLATLFSMSHLPTITQEPHITVRSMTVEPASKPIPTETWLCAVSALPDSPDTKMAKGDRQRNCTDQYRYKLTTDCGRHI